MNDWFNENDAKRILVPARTEFPAPVVFLWEESVEASLAGDASVAENQLG